MIDKLGFLPIVPRVLSGGNHHQPAGGFSRKSGADSYQHGGAQKAFPLRPSFPLRSGANESDAAILQGLAPMALLENRLATDISPAAAAEAEKIKAPVFDPGVKDLRSMNWISIDNDDSKDLDQISVAQRLPNGDIKVWVAIADVDALAPRGSAMDTQAFRNTATVYTPAKIFPMLPEKLSTDLTSLNSGQDRLAMVTEMVVAPDGSIRSENVYQAMVNNHAKLAYNSVSAWLDGKDPQAKDPLLAPLKQAGIADQLRLQDEAAGRLKSKRETNGYLDFDLQKPSAVLEGGKVTAIVPEERNRANEIIENLMVSANGVAARFLRAHGFPVIQRVVPPPSQESWQRLMEEAANYGEMLPSWPDSKALEGFLEKRKAADPVRYPDVAMSVLRLMGRALYEVERPGQAPIGHFGLAVKDYTHSTAPNRRYPDLVTQRMLKAAIAGKPCPYSEEELRQIAEHCTGQEAAIKVAERRLTKSACALYLLPQVGRQFHAVVSNAGSHGTFVRLLDIPIEGKIHHGDAHAGKFVSVRLANVDVESGHIDFELAGGRSQRAA